MIKIWIGLYAESFPGQDFWCFVLDSLALSGYSPPARPPATPRMGNFHQKIHSLYFLACNWIELTCSQGIQSKHMPAAFMFFFFFKIKLWQRSCVIEFIYQMDHLMIEVLVGFAFAWTRLFVLPLGSNSSQSKIKVITCSSTMQLRNRFGFKPN